MVLERHGSAAPALMRMGSVLETKSFFAALPQLMLISSLPVLPKIARTPQGSTSS